MTKEKLCGVVVRKVVVKIETIDRINSIASLFREETGPGAKDIDVLSWFFEQSFDQFMKSGEVEKRLARIKGA